MCSSPGFCLTSVDMSHTIIMLLLFPLLFTLFIGRDADSWMSWHSFDTINNQGSTVMSPLYQLISPHLK